MNEYNSEHYRSILGKRNGSVASHLAAKGDRNKVKECKRCNVLSLQPGPEKSSCCLMREWNVWNAWNAKPNDSMFALALIAQTRKERDICKLDSLIPARTVMLCSGAYTLLWIHQLEVGSLGAVHGGPRSRPAHDIESG